MTQTTTRATLDDLYDVEGKAELIGGRIIHYMATGLRLNRIALNICISLNGYRKLNRNGEVVSDGIGFAVAELPSGRESFSPDAAYYMGVLPANPMRFIEGAPTFAVEVRSENDYGPFAERAMAEKREDYFLAGTLVVWDVDPEAETVSVYRHDAPYRPVNYRKGEDAEAEPAVAGWKMAVDEVFAA